MPKGTGIQTVKPSRLLGGATRRIQGINSHPDDLKILGSPFRAAVSDAILDPGITVTRSLDEATFLTIPLADPDGDLRQSKLLESAFTLELDGLFFRHAGVDRNEDGTLTLRPRSREVAKLMRKTGRVKVTRGKWTRAEFIYSLVKEVRPLLPFFCPELHVTQPIKTERAAREDSVERDVRRGQGLDTGADLTVKGVKATTEQLRLGDQMLRIAESAGAPDAAMVALITAAINESTIKNVSGGTSSSVGVLQLLDIHGTLEQRMDVTYCVRKFMLDGFTGAGGAIELAKQGKSPGVIVGLVEWSAAGDPYPGLQYVPEATKWVEAFGGGGVSSSTTITRSKDFEFERKPNENTWACMKRLGDEVNWRRFEAAGVIYYIAETDLLRSRVRMRVSEDAPGIDGISWRYDSPRKAQEVSITCRAKAWAAPPGTVAFVSGEGQADGRYIVSQIESVLGDETATITLKRPTPPLPEPAAETATKTVGGLGGGVSSSEGGPESFQAMVEEAQRIDKLNLTYVFGGGHVAGMAPANGPFDCSSFVSRILQVGGFLDTTMATGALATALEEGEGDLVTVYVRNGGTGGGHTIIKLGDDFYGTTGEQPGGGPGLTHPSSSYLATLPIHRHPRGL